MDIHQFEIHFKQLASAYLQHLEQAELTALLQLFSPKAEVLSPLYGRQSATDFYTALFADTNQSKLAWKDTLVNGANNSGCIFFEYSWTLASGEVVSFDVIDPLEQTLGKTVLSSNQVLAWHMMRTAGVTAPDHLPGRLFRS